MADGRLPVRDQTMTMRLTIADAAMVREAAYQDRARLSAWLRELAVQRARQVLVRKGIDPAAVAAAAENGSNA